MQSLASYIEEHIKSRECNVYKRRVPDAMGIQEACVCLRPKIWHIKNGYMDKSPRKMSSDAKSRINFTTKIKTNAYGEARMENYSRVLAGHYPKYVRVDCLAMDNFSEVTTVMEQYWALPRPQLIISIIGGGKKMLPLTNQQLTVIKRGLLDLSHGINTWITTIGFHMGVSKIAGETVRDYRFSVDSDSNNGSGSLSCIGFASWGAIYNRDQLVNLTGSAWKSKPGSGGPRNNYTNYKQAFSEKGQGSLDPHHDAFIMCDDGFEREFGTEINYRIQFEKFLEHHYNATQVLLVLEGGKKAIQSVIKSCEMGSAVVLIRGSGRAADVICDVLECPLADLNKEIKRNLDYYEASWSLKENERFQLADALRNIREQYLETIVVFDSNNFGKGLGRAIVQAVFASNSDMSPDKKLELAQKFHRPDLAESEVFNRHLKLSPACLNRCLFNSLVCDAVPFVELIVQRGMRLPEFLTLPRLCRLYVQTVQPAYLGKLFSACAPASLTSNTAASTSQTRIASSFSQSFSVNSSDLSALQKYLHMIGELIHKLTGRCIGINIYKKKHLVNEFNQQISAALTMHDEDDDFGDVADTRSQLQATRMTSFRTKQNEFTKTTRIVDVYLDENTKKPRKLVLNASRTNAQSTSASSHVADISSSSSSTSPKTITREYCKYPVRNATGERIFTEQDLFLWALLFARIDMAKLFWRAGKDHICSALVASGICARLARLARVHSDLDNVAVLHAAELEFERLATDLLDEAFKRSPDKTYMLLRRAVPYWGDTTCMEIAYDLRRLDFLYHPACQTLINNICMGKIPSHTPTWKLIVNYPIGLFASQCVIFGHGQFKGVQPVNDVSCVPRSSRSGQLIRYENYQASPRHQSDGSDQKDANASGRVGYFKAVKYYYTAPIIKYMTSIIFYLLFLTTFAYTNLTQLKPINTTTLPTLLESDDFGAKSEYILYAFAICLISSEFKELFLQSPLNRTLRKRIAEYFSSKWNILDCLGFTLLCIAVVIRFGVGNEQLKVSRTLYSVALAVMIVQFLKFYLISQTIGPKISMIYEMLKDIIFFLAIFMTVIMAYGLLFQSLRFPSSPLNTKTFNGIIFIPYWQLYGELNLDDILGDKNCNTTSCGAQHNEAVIIACGIYMLITNILLINLLITMFGNTYNKVQEISHKLWSFDRYNLIKECSFQSSFPPPLNLISMIVLFILQILKSFGNEAVQQHYFYTEKSAFLKRLEHTENSKFTGFEQQCFESIFVKKLNEDEASEQNMEIKIEKIQLEQSNLKNNLNAANEKLNKIDDHVNVLMELIDMMTKSEHQ